MPALPPGQPPALRRRLGLGLLVLYGVGITVGAGIYVLIGAVAGHAGAYAPWAFVLAGAVMALTVGSYAELATRFPVSAGEAAYLRAAFGLRPLAMLTGLLTIVIGVVSSAAVGLGSAGYIAQFVDLPRPAIVVAVMLAMGAVAAWGILESVVFAGVLTVIEVAGLVAVIGAGLHADLPLATALHPPSMELLPLSGIAFASLLAFFAFVGFEDLANLVEEAQTPHRTIPQAMVLTLAISTVLYVAVAAVAVLAVPPAELGVAPAPLSLVFRTLTAAGPVWIGAIAIVATLNTLLAQLTTAARMVYGMARQGDLPGVLGRVNRHTATPLVATALIVAASLTLALSGSFEGLAEATSLATLAVFALVNLSLLRLRWRGVKTPGPHVRVPVWVPVAGLATCLAMIGTSFLQ